MGRVGIERLAHNDVKEAANLLARTMCTNPLNSAVFQGQGNLQRKQQSALFEVVIRDFPGEVYVAEEGGEICGVIRFVKSPDCQLSSDQRNIFIPMLEEALGETTSRVVSWMATWAKHDPKIPHWHLGPFAVKEKCQGQGIGSQLLQWFCDRCDKEHEPAYLETDKLENVHFYERFGFSVSGEEAIFSVNNYFMWRSVEK